MKYAKLNPFLYYDKFRTDYNLRERFYLVGGLSLTTLISRRWGFVINPVTISMVICPEFYTAFKGPFPKRKD